MTNYRHHQANSTSSNQWDIYWQTFEDAGYINYTPQLLATLHRHVSLRSVHVLEVGSGTGGNASELARQGAVVTTIDFSQAAIARTLATGQQTNASLLAAQADAQHLPFGSGTFDVVFHQGFLEHFTDPEPILKEQCRVLKPEGYLLVDVPQRFNMYTAYKHYLIRTGNWPYGGWEREFGMSELTSLLRQKGFRIVDRYSWGYFPRAWLLLRELAKVESRLLSRDVLPAEVWRRYDAWWDSYERSWIGCNTMMCIGLLAQKAV